VGLFHAIEEGREVQGEEATRRVLGERLGLGVEGIGVPSHSRGRLDRQQTVPSQRAHLPSIGPARPEGRQLRVVEVRNVGS
jgi:hypothetical protein